MPKPPPRAILFDYGNTLVRLEPALRSKRTDYADVVAVPGAERLAQYLEKAGLVPDRAGLVPGRAGPAFIDRFLAIREKNRIRADETGDEITASVSLRETFRAIGRPEPGDAEVEEAIRRFFSAEEEAVVEIPGAGRTLDRLSERGIRLALLSNATDEAYIERVIDRFGWRHYFESLVVSAAIGVRKPRAEAFQAVLSRWDLSPGKVAVVGDSLRHDIDGGNRLGLVTIHFTLIPNPVDPQYAGRVLPSVAVASHEELLRVLLDGAP